MEEASKQAWRDFLARPDIVGGAVEWGTRPPYYGGDITRVRNYGYRVTFHFAWAGGRTKRGWTVRAIRKITFHLSDELPKEIAPGVYRGNRFKVYLSGHTPVTQAQLVPQQSDYTR